MRSLLSCWSDPVYGLALRDCIARRGQGAATNNHGGSVAYGPLRFESGGTIYGTFPFTEICKVLNSDFKYGHIARTMPDSDDANIVLKTIDPIASPTLMQY